MLSAWALVLDRYGSPHAVATVYDGFEVTRDPETGLDVDMMPYVANLLDKLAINGSIAVTDKIGIELHQAKQAVGTDFGGFISYQDRMIYRGALVPSLIGDHGDHGSYALGNTHENLFNTMVDGFDGQLSDVIVRQLIRRLIIWKFGTQKTYGKFDIVDFKSDRKVIAEAFKDLVNTGVLKPGVADDLNLMRGQVGAPAMTQAVIDTQPEIVPGPAGKTPKEEPPGDAPTPDAPTPKAAPQKPAAGKLARKQRQRID